MIDRLDYILTPVTAAFSILGLVFLVASPPIGIVMLLVALVSHQRHRALLNAHAEIQAAEKLDRERKDRSAKLRSAP